MALTILGARSASGFSSVPLRGAATGQALPANNSIECTPVVLSDDTLLEKQELTHCKFILGPNYQVSGPNGELILSTDELEVQGGVGEVGFSVGVDGRLTVQGMPPPPLDLTLDTENAINLVVSPEAGGVLTTTGADGTVYSLEIPPGAIWGEAVEVTMTPIAAVSNLPFSGGFHWGADFAPEGLVMLEAATLTITPSSALPPEALPGRYREGGEGFHLFPMLAESGGLLFAVSHFSGAIVGSGNDTDVQALLDQWAQVGNVEESYLQLITANLGALGWDPSELTEEQRATLFLPTLTDWYTTLILPLLNQAIACGTAECADFWELADSAIETHSAWGKEAVMLGLFENSGFQTHWSEWFTTAEAGFEQVYSVWNQSCEQSQEFCDKLRRSDELLELLELLVWIGHPQAESWVPTLCGSFLETVVNSVTLRLDDTELEVGETAPISLEPRNHLDEIIAIDPEAHFVNWWTGNWQVADVWQLENPVEAEVYAFGEGTTSIEASLLQCPPGELFEEQVQITVLGPPIYDVEWSYSFDAETECTHSFPGEWVSTEAVTWSGSWTGTAAFEVPNDWSSDVLTYSSAGSINLNKQLDHQEYCPYPQWDPPFWSSFTSGSDLTHLPEDSCVEIDPHVQLINSGTEMFFSPCSDIYYHYSTYGSGSDCYGPIEIPPGGEGRSSPTLFDGGAVLSSQGGGSVFLLDDVLVIPVTSPCGSQYGTYDNVISRYVRAVRR